MFVLDLFNTKFERELNEGGVDNLEARRIDTLNDRMQELLARAREDNYKNNPAAQAALKKQFQQVKDERDSYYKVRNETMGYGKDNVNEGSMKDMLWDLSDRMDRDQFIDYTTSEMGQDADEMAQFWDNIHGPLDEAGIPGNVPTEKIPGKEDLLKGKGRSYYEANQKKNSKAVDEGQVSDDVGHRGDVDTSANIEVLDVDLKNDTFKITYNGKPYRVKIQNFSQEGLGRWQIADYDVDIINSKGKNIIDLIDWDNDRQVTMVNTIIAYLDTQQAGDIQLMAWRQVGIENSTAEELYQEIQDFYQNNQQKIDKATAWLAQNIEDAEERQVFADFVKNPVSRPARTKYIPKEYLMYVAFSYSREGNTELTPGMNLKPIQLDDPDDEEEYHRKVDELIKKVQFKFDAFENKIVELADSYGLGSDPDLGSGFGQREIVWDHKMMTTSSSESNKNRQQILAKSILNFQAEVKKYVESFNNTLIKIGLPGISEYSTWSGVLGDQLTDQQVRYFDTPEGFANLAAGKVDLAKMLDDNVEKLGLKETGNPPLGEKKLGQLRPTLGTGRDIGRSVRKFRAQRGLDEQHNPEDDDWYDDEEDQETELRSGDYVRDTMDGESGEIFRMQGDPYERRVRILDRDGKGWYIEPSRLTRVDPQDPDVQRYFGKNRIRDMDEGQFSIADDPQAHAKILFLKTINGNEYRLVKQGDAYKIYVNRSRKNKQEFSSFDLAKKALQQLLLNAVHTDEQGVAEGKADYNFDAEDLKRLERIRDLPTLKTQALALISRPSAKPMKPEKVEWFKNALDRMNSPIKVIKLMYDLLLSGEGHAVVGSRSSMNPNSYRQRFGEQGVEEGWKSTVGGAALAGAMALGAGGVQARVAGDNVDNPDVNRLTGKPNVAQTVQGDQAKPTAPSGYSKAYLQSVVDGSHPRPMVSKEKAQELLNQLREQGVSEGWSDAIVARRTGQPRTPYSVYIKGKKWKDFENEDHARAVMDKLKAKFKADGRDPSVITIAPTDMSEARATKTRLDPKCWTGKKIGNPKTKVKGGVRVNNCVPAESINEDQDTSGVERAILNRIMVAHTDLLKQFGPAKVMQAVDEVAYNVGDVDEIGTSDVSGWVRQVMQILGATP
jgi:hypothetical protein